MITEENEYIFNIMLSIFLGIMCVIMFDQLFDSPRIVDIYRNRS